MISIHWSWLVFVPVVLLLLIGIVADFQHSFPIIGLILFIVLLAFIGIFGGIFWW